VSALLSDSERLIASGAIARAGEVEVRSLASWDGSAWSDFGGGANGPVFALTHHEGSVVAAGEFTEIGGVAAARVARWTGKEWVALGSGFDGPVQTLAIHDGTLVAGGEFTATGDGREVLRIAWWRGSRWEPLGRGIGPGPREQVRANAPAEHVLALASFGGRLIAAGRFTRSGEVRLRNLAAFDGTVWTPWGEVDDEVNALAIFEGDLIAGGKFRHAGDGRSLDHVARWREGRWERMGAGFTRWVLAFLVDGERLVAGGCFRESDSQPCNGLAIWDAISEPEPSWAPLGPGVDRCVVSLANHEGSLVAGGNFTAVGRDPIRMVTWLGGAAP
jgi:hypothetical protein